MDICKKLEEILTPLLGELGYEPVFIDYLKSGKKNILRIYIDKDGGVTLNDCEKASKAIDSKLDEINLIKSSYFLEVCSPGLDRPLIKDKDFIKFQGKKIKIKTLEPVEDRSNFTGILTGFSDGILSLELIENRDKVLIPRNSIKKANLVIEI